MPLEAVLHSSVFIPLSLSPDLFLCTPCHDFQHDAGNHIGVCTQADKVILYEELLQQGKVPVSLNELERAEIYITLAFPHLNVTC